MDRVERGRQQDLSRLIYDARPRTFAKPSSFVGQVISMGHLATKPNQYVMVNPVSIGGSEVLGEDAGIVTDGGQPVPVILLNATPTLGDYLICQPEGNRWVADKIAGSGIGTGGTGVGIQGCACRLIPSRLTMISSDPNCNFGMFQSCSIAYGQTPAGYLDLQIGVNSFLSVESFPDVIANGAMFRYLFTCYFNQFNLSRVYLESPYGSPYRDGLLYSWIVGGFENSCSIDPDGNPRLSLQDGVPYPGSDASCFVTISG